ncbi:MAG: Lrp/AsnC family transcriptional regulator [Candidatus Aenigmarchaeota archaeon]|nr:Lrp/AsnC family transcriptional regulator [Candidatus Aenigmarchaeota archaeon]
MLDIKLDEKDIGILRILQENSKISSKDIAKRIGSPIPTIYAKIKRMEDLGIIKNYKAVLDAKKLGKGTTAFILISFEYRPSGTEKPLDQREIAKKIAKFPEVQELYVITGDWDILIKVKAKDVDDVGKFVLDKLRKIEGIEKTLSCMVYDVIKESSDISL